MNRKFVHQVGNNKKLYYDARPTKYQDVHILVCLPLSIKQIQQPTAIFRPHIQYTLTICMKNPFLS